MKTEKHETTYYISIMLEPTFITPGVVTTPNVLSQEQVNKIANQQGWTSLIDTEIKIYENGSSTTTLYFSSKEDLDSARKVFPLDTWTRQSGELTTADC